MRLASHYLHGNRMIFVIDVDRIAQALAALQKDRIEQRFTDRIGAAAPSGDKAHGAVAVAGQARLAEGGR